MNLLDTVIMKVNVTYGRSQNNRNIATFRRDALVMISEGIDHFGLWRFCKEHDALVNNSAEEFAIQFYTAYNNEVCPGTF
jgi:hypothetical protein